MFVVLLEFTDDRSKAGQFMEGHRMWLDRGFEDGVFLLAGGLRPNEGGAVLAHNVSPTDLHKRVQTDPFVAQGVVTAQILEIAPSKCNPRLDFLLA